MRVEDYNALLDEEKEQNLYEYEQYKKTGRGVARCKMTARRLNDAASLDDWSAKCTRAGIGILGVHYWLDKDDNPKRKSVLTVAEFEYQWRYGSGADERRWAKSVFTYTAEWALTGEAVAMLVYDRVKELRAILENKG